jgi:hypothetical protein
MTNKFRDARNSTNMGIIMGNNPDYHRSRALEELLSDAKEAAALSKSQKRARIMEAIPVVQFSIIALLCGFGTLFLVSKFI